MARVRTVGAVVFDANGRLLLVQRGRPPAVGRWTVPGGHVEAGETDEAAVVREVREETGLTVRVDRLGGQIDLPGRSGAVYDNRDYVCTVLEGRLRAGDDAAAVGWFGGPELATLPLTDGLLEILTDWGLLPVPGAPNGPDAAASGP